MSVLSTYLFIFIYFQKKFDFNGNIDVNKVRFFPSGLVVLACGDDMSVRVFSVETGLCHRTFLGHIRSKIEERLHSAVYFYFNLLCFTCILMYKLFLKLLNGIDFD